MTQAADPGTGPGEAPQEDPVAAAFGRRVEPGLALADDAARIAAACHAMAVRFHRGGKAVIFGSGAAATDAQHLAVEFVHPVGVGKRALPAISLANDAPTLTGLAEGEGCDAVFAAQLRILGRPNDVAVGISADGRSRAVPRAFEAAREAGMLTIALVGGDGGEIAASGLVDHVLPARTRDPRIAKEVHVTIYHVLWELVHVFLDQPGLLRAEAVR
jgi:D-sedoheptulose 7-phosphate isomerase